MGFLTCLCVGTFWGERSGQERATGVVGWVARTRAGKGQERGRVLAEFGQRMRKREKSQEGMNWWHFKTVRKKMAVVSKASMCPGQPGCVDFRGMQCGLQDLGNGCTGAAWLRSLLTWSLLFSLLLWGLCGGPSASFCAFFLSSAIIAGEEKKYPTVSHIVPATVQKWLWHFHDQQPSSWLQEE